MEVALEIPYRSPKVPRAIWGWFLFGAIGGCWLILWPVVTALTFYEPWVSRAVGACMLVWSISFGPTLAMVSMRRGPALLVSEGELVHYTGSVWHRRVPVSDIHAVRPLRSEWWIVDRVTGRRPLKIWAGLLAADAHGPWTIERLSRHLEVDPDGGGSTLGSSPQPN